MPCSRSILVQHNGRSDILAQASMRHCKSHRLGHRRMLHEDSLHFLRCDFFPTTINDLLKAPRDEQIAISIEISLITRSKPTMRESVLVGRRIVRVTMHDSRTTHDNLAGFSGG